MEEGVQEDTQEDTQTGPVCPLGRGLFVTLCATKAWLSHKVWVTQAYCLFSLDAQNGSLSLLSSHSSCVLALGYVFLM